MEGPRLGVTGLGTPSCQTLCSISLRLIQINMYSVSEPKRLLPDSTLKGVPDPDPTLQVFPDPTTDLGQNSPF